VVAIAWQCAASAAASQQGHIKPAATALATAVRAVHGQRACKNCGEVMAITVTSVQKLQQNDRQQSSRGRSNAAAAEAKWAKDGESKSFTLAPIHSKHQQQRSSAQQRKQHHSKSTLN